MLNQKLTICLVLSFLLLGNSLSVAFASTGDVLLEVETGSIVLSDEPQILGTGSVVIEDNNLLGKLFLNEIMVNPEEGKEWVEIYNDSSERVNLSGIKIADAVGMRYVFEEGLFLEAKSFVVIEFYNVFNNTGDQVYLQDFEEKLLDSFSYGVEGDFIQEIQKGKSAGRVQEGNAEWVIFEISEVSRGCSNQKEIAEEVVEIEIPEENVLVQSGALLLELNEIYANAIGADEGQEWIELKFGITGTGAVNNYFLEINEEDLIDLNGIEFSGTGGFVTLNPNDFGIVLRNSNTHIQLKQSVSNSVQIGTGEVVEEVFYTDAHEGMSWRKNLETGEWEENYHSTFGEENILWNTEPLAIITVQGSGKTSGIMALNINVTGENSSDVDGDELTCDWDFGDGELETVCNPKAHLYTAGNYILKLVVRDFLGAKNSQTINIVVTTAPSSSGGGGSEPVAEEDVVETEEQQENIYSDLPLEIWSALPNPEGQDKGQEWITLFNPNNQRVNLNEWIIKNSKKSYVFSQFDSLAPYEKKKFLTDELMLNLINKKDELSLWNYKNVLISTLVWEDAQSGQEYGQEISTEEIVIDEKEMEQIEIKPVCKKIRLSEIYPNTKEGDKENEWIEIVNLENQDCDLAGWKIQDASNKKYTFPVGVIVQDKGFYLVKRLETGITLNNKKDKVVLINPQDKIVDKFSYDKTKKGCSWACNQKRHFLLTCFVTAGEENLIVSPKLQKDTDQDGILDVDEELIYKTNPLKRDTDMDGIPDGFEVYNALKPLKKNTDIKSYQNFLEKITTLELESHENENFILKGKTQPNAIVRLFLHSKLVVGAVKADEDGNWEYELQEGLEKGGHEIEMQLITPEGVKTDKKIVKQFNLEDDFEPIIYSQNLKIESIFPNPEGKDMETEFFTLVNEGLENIDLTGWQIQNQVGKKYIIQKGELKPQERRVFKYKETKMSLHNQVGFLELLNPKEVRGDLLIYQGAKEGDIFTHMGVTDFIETNNIIEKEEKKEEFLIEFTGNIISEINSDESFFWIKTEENEELKVFFESKKYPYFLATLFFKKGNKLLVQGVYEEEEFHLKDFNLLKQQNILPDIITGSVDFGGNLKNQIWVYFFLLIMLGGGYFWVRKMPSF